VNESRRLPNAGHQAQLKAGTQRTLEAVGWTPWLGPALARGT
jgi:hypothetical protein